MRYFEENEMISSMEIDQAIDFCILQDKQILPDFTHRFKKAYSVDNFYEGTENRDWTTGFWTGELWLDFENSGDKAFLEAANIQIDSFLKRIQQLD